VLPLLYRVLALVVLKESITPLVVAVVVILLSTIMVTVYESEILHWLGRTTRPLF
jgi:hypothetical protein